MNQNNYIRAGSDIPVVYHNMPHLNRWGFFSYICLMSCLTDSSKRTFTNIAYCTTNYSLGTSDESTLTIRLTEVESGRVAEIEDVANASDRFIFDTTFFNPYNTFTIEVFDSEGEQVRLASEYDSYEVHFKAIKDNEGDPVTQTTVNIG